MLCRRCVQFENPAVALREQQPLSAGVTAGSQDDDLPATILDGAAEEGIDVGGAGGEIGVHPRLHHIRLGVVPHFGGVKGLGPIRWEKMMGQPVAGLVAAIQLDMGKGPQIGGDDRHLGDGCRHKKASSFGRVRSRPVCISGRHTHSLHQRLDTNLSVLANRSQNLFSRWARG